MAFLFDRRPTLASWPKRIYAWSELPEQFQCALARWKDQGLPPGNVTYIPRVNQYANSPEFATAWLGEEVLIQESWGGDLRCLQFHGAEAALVDYYVQLLRCTVTISLDGDRSGQQCCFSYNKTKEDQLLPILNLALGASADHVPRPQHPDTPALRGLLRDSYAMYNLSKLCYRFGEEIQDFLWLVGRNRGLARLNRSRPESFIARTERGLAWLQKDFYGTRMLTVPWDRHPRFEIEVSGSRSALCLFASSGAVSRWELLPEHRARAEAFLSAFPASPAH